MADCQSVNFQLTHRYREQAPSHILFCAWQKSLSAGQRCVAVEQFISFMRKAGAMGGAQ
ncbi:hypothetical protein C4J95_0154 [Pseudomonas orientalis]|nr:hypothetical protein C4J96_0155 [Pseudomonas orientalis]AZE97648.1 hypothetical protein C4J95_0153 [Pseudomonas orientalis]AZE97649.1 hypothetical protein C4J95_0154 [Pseudomonas orientalis]